MPNRQVKGMIGAAMLVSHTTVAVHELLLLPVSACQIRAGLNGDQRGLTGHWDSTRAEQHPLFPSSEAIGQ
jgi:hypothetical protein